MSTTRWASCSREVNPVVAEYRHIVRRGALTTACGATASTPDVWRGNRNKPKCPTCLKAAVVIGSPRPERRPPMTDTTPAGGTEHPGCTEPRRPPAPTRPSSTSAGAGRPNPPVPAEGTEGHEHLWQRRQSVTSKGDAMPAYEVCVIPGCDRARRADRPTSPAPAAEDDAAVLALIDALNVCGDDRGCQCEDAHETAAWVVRRVLDAAGVPALRAEVERLASRLADCTDEKVRGHVELGAARQQVADLRALASEMLSRFMHPGHPGVASHRTDWVADTTIDRWRAALAESGEQPGDETGARCCTAPDCCGPGSWCCTRAGAHTHEPGDDEHLPGVNVTQQVVPDHSLNAVCLLDGCVAHGTATSPAVPDSAKSAPSSAKAWSNDSATLRERMHENWRVFKKHVPAGAYLPVGQMDGDCRECGGSWPCAAVLAVVGSGVTAECDPWAGCPVHGDKHWRAALEHAVSRVEVRAERAERALAAVVRSGEPAPSTTTEGES